MENVLISILIGIVGIVLGIIIRMVMEKMGLAKAKASAQTVLDEANNKAENIVRQATLDGKQQIYELKL